MWRGQIDELSEDFHVLAPDLRGFGGSDISPGLVSMQQFADDLASLLDQRGIRQSIIFCGLSMGGYIAWQFWRRHVDRLSRLILCDTRAAADTTEAAQARCETARRVLQEGTAFLAETMIPKLFSERTRLQNRSIVAATRRSIEMAPRTGVAAALCGMAERADATPWLPDIQIPTLVLCGQQDAISPVAEMQAIADAIPGAEFAVIPACGHMAPLEGPIHVNKAIRGFLGAPRRS
jgi:pimeloyl-ACP methyl ester carboxylesterase